MAKQKPETVASLTLRLAHFRTLPVNPLTPQTIASMERNLEVAREGTVHMFFGVIPIGRFRAEVQAVHLRRFIDDREQRIHQLASLEPAGTGIESGGERALVTQGDEALGPQRLERLLKITQLIDFKENDRKRGIGSVDKDYERVQERLAA